MSFFISRLRLFFWSCCFLVIGSANAADAMQLKWKSPTAYENGLKLNAMVDLKEYRLYYGRSVATIKNHVVVLKPSARSVALSSLELSKLKAPLVYFAMTSVSKAGLESALSPSIFYLP